MTTSLSSDAGKFENINGGNFPKEVLERSQQLPVVVLFHAKWHPPSRQMATVLPHMQKEFGDTVKFCVVDCDSCEKLVRQEGVHSYPTTTIYRFGGCVSRVPGAHPPKLLAAVKEALTMKEMAPDSALNRCETQVSPDEKTRLYALTRASPVMIFIKGTKEKPFCKFSKEAVTILNDTGFPYETFDVFQDRAVRDGLKLLFDWPTFPQLFVKGEFLGGVDILKIMAEDGSLLECLNQACPTTEACQTPSSKAKQTHASGTGAKGDFVLEPALRARLSSLVCSEPVMLFMKGTPEEPRCGFSRQIVDTLIMSHVTFGHFDILQDDDVRQGLKALFDWPTYPQLYAYGEFIGGLDVVKETISSGGTEALLEEIETCRKRRQPFSGVSGPHNG